MKTYKTSDIDPQELKNIFLAAEKDNKDYIDSLGKRKATAIAEAKQTPIDYKLLKQSAKEATKEADKLRRLRYALRSNNKGQYQQAKTT